jgi:hypothetical protein
VVAVTAAIAKEGITKMRHWALAGLLLTISCAVHTGGDNEPPPTSTQPLTVVVDTNQTMTAQGGQGVGVFVQYAAGGHWHVFWACDTQLSGLPCDYKLTITGTSIANAKPSQFEQTDALDSATTDQLVATTHVTTGIDAVDFDATPGADMKIDLTMSGLRSGEFFFFVENGQVNGNFPSDKLSDPLIFEPSTP